MKDEMGFKYTPEPRDLTNAEVDEFHLWYSDRVRIPCIFKSTDIVWSAAGTENDTWYRLYNQCTNGLVVLKFKPSVGKWERSCIEDIKNMYGLLWKMILRLESCKRKLDEVEKEPANV